MSISSSFSDFWRCPNCLAFVPVGHSHTCSPVSAPYTSPAYLIDPLVLDRIAKALETIASQLAEKHNET